MNRRQYTRFGNALPPGLTKVEDDLAQVPSLAAWISARPGFVNTAQTGVLDRIERGAVRLANGKTELVTRFFDSVDLSGGVAKKGLSVQDEQTGIVVPIDTTGDFAVGFRVQPSSLIPSGGRWGGVALGSFGSAANAWRLDSDTTGAGTTEGVGRLRMAAGGLTTAYADYAGPAVTPGVPIWGLLRFFRAEGRLNLRVQGAAWEQNLQGDALKTAVLASPLGLGLFWDLSVPAARHRRGLWLKALTAVSAAGAGGALVGADLAAAEAYLADPASD